MRAYYKVTMTILTLGFLIIFSPIVRTSIYNSLTICAKFLIPSLFPFFIISGMLFDFGIDIIFPPTLCSFIIGLFCGFPIGTKSLCESYNKENLTKKQASALLLCTANASPAFIVITLGEAILKNKELGYLLLVCQAINAISLYLLTVPKSNFKINKSITKDVSTSLIDNTKSATEQILFVCSMTTVFGILFDLLATFLKGNFIKLSAFVELLHGITLFDKKNLLIIAAVLGFSGICAISQCIFFIKKTDLNIAYLFLGKIQASIVLPLYATLFINNKLQYKIISLIIILLTNIGMMCIMNIKGCENKNDFFKKHRKMLRLLRTSNKNSFQRTSTLPP